jgi:hypothetical protein
MGTSAFYSTSSGVGRHSICGSYVRALTRLPLEPNPPYLAGGNHFGLSANFAIRIFIAVHQPY